MNAEIRSTMTDASKRVLALLDRGYTIISHDRIKPGQRVYHHNEKWAEARDKGTATVIAVLSRAGNLDDVEVVVQCDRDDRATDWASYTTNVVEPW